MGEGSSLLRQRNVRIEGSGARQVVLGHGFGTNQSAWEAVLPWFAARFQVLRYDLAGAPGSANLCYDPAQHNSLHGFADDLTDILRSLDIEGAIYVGHSVSGMIGLLSALVEPWRYRRMVLINPSPCYLNKPGYHGGFDRRELDRLYAGMVGNYEAWVHGFAPIMLGVSSGPSLEGFSNSLLAMRPDIAVAVARTVFDSDYRSLLPRIEVPVSIIHNLHDPAVPPEVVAYMQANLRDCEVFHIKAPGHLPHLTHPRSLIGVFENELALSE